MSNTNVMCRKSGDNVLIANTSASQVPSGPQVSGGPTPRGGVRPSPLLCGPPRSRRGHRSGKTLNEVGIYMYVFGCKYGLCVNFNLHVSHCMQKSTWFRILNRFAKIIKTFMCIDILCIKHLNMHHEHHQNHCQHIGGFPLQVIIILILYLR